MSVPHPQETNEGSPISDAQALIAALNRRIDGCEPRLRPYIDTTPVMNYPAPASGTVLVKCEHRQRTGSFKARGAVAKLLTLTGEQRRRGVIAASSGNHGLGVAYALSRLGGSGVVCVPEHASPVKVAAIEALGVTVRQLGTEPGETEKLTRAYAGRHGLTYISPYNDLEVIAGQGSIGVELDHQLGARPLHTVVVSVGGGGLASGVAAAIKARRPEVRVVGASPVNDAAMCASVGAGRVVTVDTAPTLSDGTAGALEPGAITLRLCAELVDDWILVDEQQIRDTLRQVIDRSHQLIEGAAAVAVAAALTTADARPDECVAVISCGANISSETLASALTR